MHVLAYRASIANTGILAVGGLLDQVYFLSNGRFLMPDPRQVYWAYASGTTITRARLVTPNYAPQGYPYIRPIQRPAIGSWQSSLADYRRNPLRIPAKQYLEAQAAQGAAGAEVETIVLGIGSQLGPAVPGMLTTIRGTSSTAATSGAWSTLAVDWEYTLEGGFYQVVGGQAFSANGIAFRLVSQFQIERPGGLMITNLAQSVPAPFEPFGMGKWCEFQSESMPVVEVLCGAADSSFDILLDVVKIR